MQARTPSSEISIPRPVTPFWRTSFTRSDPSPHPRSRTFFPAGVRSRITLLSIRRPSAHVVLNQTLQAVKKPDVVLSEILRVGKKGVVGFPNFAYWKMRAYLFTFGRMPKTEFLPFEWYDTPNIHFCSILDFTGYCAKNGVTIEKTVYLSTDRGGRVLRGVRPNLFAENAVFLLSARKS